MECAIRRILDKFSSKQLHVQENESFCNYTDNKLSNDDGVLFDWMMITGDRDEHRNTLIEIIKLGWPYTAIHLPSQCWNNANKKQRKPQIKVKILDLNYLQ